MIFVKTNTRIKVRAACVFASLHSFWVPECFCIRSALRIGSCILSAAETMGKKEFAAAVGSTGVAGRYCAGEKKKAAFVNRLSLKLAGHSLANKSVGSLFIDFTSKGDQVFAFIRFRSDLPDKPPTSLLKNRLRLLERSG